MIPRILLVEDEVTIREAIKFNLEMENYEVVIATDGVTAFRIFNEQRFNLVVLDVMLPKMDGFQVCRQIRLEDTHTPILFLTAKDANIDKIAGLKLGADDYITKPFNLEEFLLRIKVLVRHSMRGTEEEEQLHIYSFGGNTINFINYTAKGTEGEIKLTKKELMLLKLLIEQKNKVVSRQQILQTAWGYDVYPSTRTIDNFILAFRKYFEKDPKKPKHFFSVRGVGYRFME